MTSAPDQQADILLVDDTPANLTVLSAILSKRGYRVRAAPNGEGGLRTARKSPPDLILLDIQMPQMNGYEVCRVLKSDDQTRHVPVIFISALDDALDKVEAFEVGGVDYITKPFQIEEVLVRVENQLALQRQRETLGSLSTPINRILHCVESLLASADHPDRTALLTEIQESAQSMQASVQSAHSQPTAKA